ncbi:hypothetical protein SAMN05421771_0677 [Granulicella pectinivorans]|uniref:Uncharacterized protein n=2 Tax=Granulicella pectinivorans TaxID=474950 RepID=A0A1I6LG51_9BACT|nr:hypothetical protein SAMN05421771_0677 [Granulicella pectinivorans]
MEEARWSSPREAWMAIAVMGLIAVLASGPLAGCWTALVWLRRQRSAMDKKEEAWGILVVASAHSPMR